MHLATVESAAKYLGRGECGHWGCTPYLLAGLTYGTTVSIAHNEGI